MYYETEEVGFVPYTPGPNQGHRDFFSPHPGSFQRPFAVQAHR